ncbi:lysophospholipase-like protein 1 [Drosophila albomicans]|uniref:palmitoyl-protein hydrolase n=1 Tax=Drosophila albomicans TaxID=7291 RepID=A0A6P8XRI1_DROAB|nr:lysophospholipase-like protein 1 [Drosophila albomicans]
MASSAIRKHSASLIFFHGSGETGQILIDRVRYLLGRDFNFAHINVVYPTAPLQEYTPLKGQLSKVWFDRNAVDIADPIGKQNMTKGYAVAQQLIQYEVTHGIPLNRIIVGGFSMGGALALHTGYHLTEGLAGVFTHSSFLYRNSVVFESLRNRKFTKETLPELRMFHGQNDTLVPPEWGRETSESLAKLGVSGTFTPLEDTLHVLRRKSLLDIEKWILTKLPPL